MFTKFKKILSSAYKWLCTPSGTRTLLIISGIILTGGGLAVLYKRNKWLKTSYRTINTSPGAGTGIATIGATFASAGAEINRLQQELGDSIKSTNSDIENRVDGLIFRVEDAKERIEQIEIAARQL